MSEQSYANHRRFVPAYHYVAAGILAVNFLWALYRLFWPLPGVPVFDRLLAVAVALALALVLLYARTFPLKAQDRVIRLEERLRLERLLPEDLKQRLGELRTGHFVALRFAGDAEVTDLVRKVLAGDLKTQDDIKKAIGSWRADHLRV